MNPSPAMPSIDHSPTLAELESLFSRPAASRESFLAITDLAIHLAAHGHAEAVLELTRKTCEKALFKPLADGLHLHLGHVIESTGAARSLAIYIAGRIRQETHHHVAA